MNSQRLYARKRFAVALPLAAALLAPLTASAQVAHDLPASPLCTPLVLQATVTPTDATAALSLATTVHPQPVDVTPLIVLTPEQVETLVRQQRLGAQAEAAGLVVDPAQLGHWLTWLGRALQTPGQE